MKNPLRIIVQENDNDFRRQLEQDVKHNEGFELLKSYKSFYALADEAHFFSADLILVNWHYPTQKLFDFISSLKKDNLQTKVLVTFDFVQPDFVFRLLQLGVEQCLLKPFSIDEILNNKSELIIGNKFSFHINQLHLQNKMAYVKR